MFSVLKYNVFPCTLISDVMYRYLFFPLKDTTVKIWDCILGQLIRTLSSHTKSVTCIKWGGEGLIYSSSQDRTIKVWRAEDVSRSLYKNKLVLMPMFLLLQHCHTEIDILSAAKSIKIDNIHN